MKTFSTLAELFLNVTAEERPDLLRSKRGGVWKTVSAEEVRRRSARLAFRLLDSGLAAGDRVGLLSENSPEWAIADFACIVAGLVVVPIYPTLTAAQTEYILKDSGAKAIFVSSLDQSKKVETCRVIRLDELPPELPDEARLTDQEEGRLEAMARARKAEDLFSILYTSGTTGEPKGVMLTHRNLCSNIQSSTLHVGPGDLALSFLPLCHIYERMADYSYLCHGASIAYVAAIDEVPQALVEVRPTVMAAVPRFFEKLYDRVMEQVRKAPAWRQKLFAWAMRQGKRRLAGRGTSFEYGLAERLVFRRLRDRLGGRLRFVISGSAPLSPALAEFFLGCGLPICEGYGLTETSPVLTANQPDSIRIGTVGKPIAGVEIKIAPDGEILARGPNIMQGYYKRPEETAQAIRDGWFHTGDIGRLDADGYLTITDRKKDLLKTAGGKYVAPQPIENKLKTNPYIQNVVVLGDKHKFVSALIAANVGKLQDYARDHGIVCASPGELVRHPKILEFMQQQVDESTPDLAHFERIKKILLTENDFTIANGSLTPTMKVKRNIIEKQYAEQIAKLYEEKA